MDVTDIRMSCARSRSLLLAEFMKMPSSSVVEVLDDVRRPTRPFQPRPGEALQTEPAPTSRTLTGHFTRAAFIPDVSLSHDSPAFCPNEVNFDVKIPRLPLINTLFNVDAISEEGCTSKRGIPTST